MNKKSVEYIIFDLGGVLIKIHPDKFFPLVCTNPSITPSKLFEVASDINLGLRPVSELVKDVITTLNISISQKEFMRLFTEVWIGDVIPFMYKVVSKLKARGYKVCVLSNTNKTHVEYFSPGFDDFDLFDKTYFSHEIHLEKPGKEIYEYVIKDLNVAPSKVLFMDDLEENIQGAKGCGMQTLHVKSNNPDPKKLLDFLGIL